MEEHNERMTSGRREVYPRDDGPSLFLAADLDTDTNVFVNDFDVPEQIVIMIKNCNGGRLVEGWQCNNRQLVSEANMR